jgi:hypothetical protein
MRPDSDITVSEMPASGTPDEQLAHLIANALIQSGLLLPDERLEVAEQIAAGEMTGEEWVAMIARAVNGKAGAADDGEWNWSDQDSEVSGGDTGDIDPFSA